MSAQKNKIVIYAMVALLALAGGGYWVRNNFFGASVQNENEPAVTLGDWWKSDGNETSPSPASDDSPQGNASSDVILPGGNLTQIYTDDVYDFSFRFPEGLSTVKMPEESGDLILVQGPEEKTFQVFVSPFDEPSSELTPDRIRFDLPNTEVINPQQIAIGGMGIPALIFNSKHQSLGDIREVWFVWPPDPLPYGNYLYQISAYADLDAFLGPILETWQFQ